MNMDEHGRTWMNMDEHGWTWGVNRHTTRQKLGQPVAEVVKLRPKAEIGVDDEKEALRQYAEKFGECRDGTEAGLGLFLLLSRWYVCFYYWSIISYMSSLLSIITYNVGYWLVWGYTIVSPDSKIIVYPGIGWGVHYCVPRILVWWFFFLFFVFFSF